MRRQSSNSKLQWRDGHIYRWALALLFALSLPLLITAFAQGNSQQSRRWVNTNDSVFNSATTQYQGLANPNQPVSITVALQANNKELLRSHVTAQHTPGNPSYGHWLSRDQARQYFSPPAASARAVADYLTAKGFTNVQIADNRLLVTADGTVALARQAFNTQIGVFTLDNGDSGIANTSPIQVPASLSHIISSVLGLDTTHRMHTNRSPVAGSPVAHTDASCAVVQSTPPYYSNCTAAGNTDGYFPNQFSTVYGRPSNQTGRSTGVAIIGWGNMTNPMNDLAKFETSQGISPLVPVSALYCTTANCTATVPANANDKEQFEWAMDAQAIVGISGGVSKLTFYASPDGTIGTLERAINAAGDDLTIKIINMSWGMCETNSLGTASQISQPMDTAFEIAITQGKTFVASTGDYGSTEVNKGCPFTTTQCPASSPNVIAIGGTTLTTSNLVYSSEKTWNSTWGCYDANDNVGTCCGSTGGGISKYEPNPSWQSSPTGKRLLPDLAFDADGNTGMWVWLTPSTDSGVTANGCAGGGGGTSLAAPLFAGTWAVLQSANNNDLGFAPPLFYLYSGQLYGSGALHDVTTGNNQPPSNQPGYVNLKGLASYGNPQYFAATGGYDQVTGLGSFDIGKMLTAIAGGAHIYMVTPSVSGSGGAINPAATVWVASGKTTSLTLTPNTGYTASVGGTCGGTLSGNTYTTKAITTDCTVAATFTPATYTVTSNTGTGGSISPLGAATVSYNATKAYTLTPNTGYVASSVTGTCGGTLSGNTFTTKAITAACTVVANFTTAPIYTVSVQWTSFAGVTYPGTISPSGNPQVQAGKTVTFTLTPYSGYVASSVQTNCGGATWLNVIPLNGSTFTTNPITGNCTFNMNWAQATTAYTVTSIVSGSGTVSPASIQVQSGGTAKFTLVPGPGVTSYGVSFGNPSCGPGTLTGPFTNETYTVGPISSNCNFVVKF